MAGAIDLFFWHMESIYIYVQLVYSHIVSTCAMDDSIWLRVL